MTGERLKALVFACTGIEEDLEWTRDHHDENEATWFAIHTTTTGREFVAHTVNGGVWIKPVKFSQHPPAPARAFSYNHIWDCEPRGGEKTSTQ